MDKEAVLVRVSDGNQIKLLVEDLRRAGIRCRENVGKNEITTKNIVLKCVRTPMGVDQRKYVRGLRAVGCFYFDDKTTDYITRGNNVCKGYSIEKYVKDMEEMGY